ncbi:DUF2269 family protein [Pontibacillus salicampi]|uniref:DUF2269 family protein n=1 Tax=Pontibacillus salicampi TaxID=1449801 RepID=A0ABV6LUB2_9BACI
MLSFFVLVHVLSGIIGIGPTYYAHVLIRPHQSPEQLRASLALLKRLEYFPKIGGTIAVVSGLLLVLIGDYGSFMQLWLFGSLVLYLAVQVIMVTLVSPRSAKLHFWVHHADNQGAEDLPAPQHQLLLSMNAWMNAASSLGLILFILMILKP